MPRKKVIKDNEKDSSSYKKLGRPSGNTKGIEDTTGISWYPQPGGVLLLTSTPPPRPPYTLVPPAQISVLTLVPPDSRVLKTGTSKITVRFLSHSSDGLFFMRHTMSLRAMRLNICYLIVKDV